MIFSADKEFWKARTLPASLLGLALLSWVGVYNLSFISDDFPLLAEQFIKPFTLFTPTAYFIAPVFKLFLSLGSILFGTAAVGYYAIILITHLANVFLFFKLLQKFGFDEKVAFVSALIWGTLAQYAEALFWISGSVHVFTLFFVLFSAYTAIKWDETQRVCFLVISILLLVSGFLCRESAALFLFVWAVYLVIKKYRIKDIILKLLPFIITVAVLILTMQLLRSSTGLEPQKYLNIDILVILRNFIYYTVFNLTGIQYLPSAAIIIFLFTAIILSGIFLFYRSRYFPVALLYLFFLLPYLMMEYLPQRYSYTTSLWLFPPIVWFGSELYKRFSTKFARYGLISFLCLFVMLSWLRISFEHSDYKYLSEEHEKITDAAKIYLSGDQVKTGNIYCFVQTAQPEAMMRFSRSSASFEKPLIIRYKGVAGLVYLNDLLNFTAYGYKVGPGFNGCKLCHAAGEDALDALKAGNLPVIIYQDNTLKVTEIDPGYKDNILAEGRMPGIFVPYKLCAVAK